MTPVDQERRFIESYDPEEFERPSVTVDLVLLSVKAGSLQVLLLRRSELPERGKWALPGGFVGLKESLDAAARRVMQEKAQLGDAYMEQLYTFGGVKRDPRMRIISVAYYALLNPAELEAAEARSPELTLARVAVPWEGEAGGPVAAHGVVEGRKKRGKDQTLPLAFDHAEILGMAVQRLRGKLDYSPVGFELLPREFTLRQLQEVHEAILGTSLNKPAFRRRLLDKGFLDPTGQREEGVTYRPAELYRFRRT